MSETQRRRISIKELAFDCVSQVVEFLSSPKDLINVFLTFKGFVEHVSTLNCQCCQNIKFVLKEIPTTENIIVPYCLEMLINEEINQNLLEKVCKVFPNVRKIKIDVNEIDEIDENHNQVINQSIIDGNSFNFRSLHMIDVFYDGIITIQNIQNVKNFIATTIFGKNEFGSHGLPHEDFPSGGISRDCFRNRFFLYNLSSLKELVLYGWNIVFPINLLNCLENLTIENCFFDVPILSGLDKLIFLKIINANNISEIKDLPELRDLEFTNKGLSHSFCQIYIQKIEGLPKLERLSINSPLKRPLNDIGFVKLKTIRKLPMLKRLVFKNAEIDMEITVSETPELLSILIQNCSPTLIRFLNDAILKLRILELNNSVLPWLNWEIPNSLEMVKILNSELLGLSSNEIKNINLSWFLELKKVHICCGELSVIGEQRNESLEEIFFESPRVSLGSNMLIKSNCSLPNLKHLKWSFDFRIFENVRNRPDLIDNFLSINKCKNLVFLSLEACGQSSWFEEIVIADLPSLIFLEFVCRRVQTQEQTRWNTVKLRDLVSLKELRISHIRKLIVGRRVTPKVLVVEYINSLDVDNVEADQFSLEKAVFVESKLNYNSLRNLWIHLAKNVIIIRSTFDRQFSVLFSNVKHLSYMGGDKIFSELNHMESLTVFGRMKYCEIFDCPKLSLLNCTLLCDLLTVYPLESEPNHMIMGILEMSNVENYKYIQVFNRIEESEVFLENLPSLRKIKIFGEYKKGWNYKRLRDYVDEDDD